jgi:hypothetical protein
MRDNIRTDKEFLGDLRKELISTQDSRLKLTLQKLAFITGLFAVGGIFSFDDPKLNPFLLTPIFAIIYDMFIEGENFGIRRIGNFLKLINKVPPTERIWETVLNMRKANKFGKFFPIYLHRDIFVTIANPLATCIIYTIALLYVNYKWDLLKSFAWWYIIAIFLLFFFWLLMKAIIMRNRLDKVELSLKKSLSEKGLLNSCN